VKLRTFGTVGLVVLIPLGTFVGRVFGRWTAYRRPQGPVTCAEADKLRWIEQASLQQDFQKHVEREHDMRFLSMYGLSFSEEFPGLDDTPEMQRLTREHGVRHMEGTTDVISCIEQKQFSDRVFQYAMRYNSMLLGYLEHAK
jgi:uncharacterized protein YfaT (DUF1175 family)